MGLGPQMTFLAGRSEIKQGKMQPLKMITILDVFNDFPNHVGYMT